MAWAISTKSREALPFIGLAIYGGSTLTSMAGMSIGAGIFILCLLASGRWIATSRSHWDTLRKDRFARTFALATFLLAVAILLSWVSAFLNPPVFNQVSVRPAWGNLGKLWYLSLPFLLAMAWSRTTEAQKRKTLLAWWWAFFSVSWLAIPEFFWGWPRNQGNPDLQPYHHPVLLLGHHLSVASVWIFPFFVTLDGLFKRGWSKLISRKWLALGLILAFTLLMLLYSRMLWIALPIGLAVWAISTLPGRFAIGAVVTICLAALAATQLPVIQKRWTTPLGRNDRWDIWNANVVLFQQRPILGVGFGNTQETVRQYYYQNRKDQSIHFVGHAHNLFLEMATGSGVVGLAALLFWFCALAALILGGLKKAPEFATPVGILCALLVFLLNGLTQVNLWEGKVFHQVAWITGWVLSWIQRGKPSA
jgi:O-antigen ligase